MILPVIVFGNGDLYSELFNAIAASMHDRDYHYLIHFAILASGTWVIFRYTAEKSLMGMVKWLLMYYFAFFICFKPVCTVEIIDEVNLGKAYAVDNVPLGLGVMASFVSRIGGGLTQLIEKTFSLPDDLKYSQTGMVMASRLVTNASQFEVTDPNFNESLQGFVHQCVFYDLLLNRYSLSDLMGQTDLWGFLQSNASKARSFLYYSLDGTPPAVVPCSSGVLSLTHDWKGVMDSAAAHYGSRLFPQASDPKSELMAYLPESYQFLTKTSQSATQLLQQNMMSNAIQNGVLQMSTTTNAPAALENYAFTKAQLQKRLSNETMGDQAAYWLPLMKNVLEATLYGSFVFIFLLFLFPFGGTILRNYCGSLLWLQLWAPLYAILNLFMTFYAQHKTMGAMGGPGGQMGLSLYTQSGVAQINADMAGLAGYLSLSVPVLAAGVLKGMMSVVAQAAQYIAGVTQGASISASSEAVSGNLSMGNLNYNNQSSFNTSANHFDTSARTSSGMVTNQMAGGSTLSMTLDSTLIMNNQSGISNLGTSANLAQSLRASYTQQAESAQITALNQSKTATDASTSAMRSLYELGHHSAESTAGGEGWSYSTNASTSHALQEVNRLTEQFAENHHISFGQASSVLGSAYAKGSAGLSTNNTLIGKLGVNAGGQAGYQHASSNTDSVSTNTLYNDAKSFIHDTNFAQNISEVEQATHDHTLRATTDEGNRLIQNMGASFDQSASARAEASSSFQQSQTFREMASYAQENAVNINSNASQVVYETLMKEGMTSGQIEDMMAHHPDVAAQKAQAAVEAYSEQLSQGWAHGLPASPEALNNVKTHNDQFVDSKTEVQKTKVSDNAQVDAKVAAQAETQKLAPHQQDAHYNAIRTQSQAILSKDKNDIVQKDSSLEKKGNQLQQKEAREKARRRSGSVVKDLFTGIDLKDDD